MPIENRSLLAGTRLVANYKKQTHVCTIEADEEGKTAFVLPDGRRFKSPSSAASAIMGGKAVNGWRFWSLEGEGAEPKAQATTDKPEKKNGAGSKLISRTPNQKGVTEGQVRYFCNGCMASFTAPTGQEPTECPAGHRIDDPELTAQAVS